MRCIFFYSHFFCFFLKGGADFGRQRRCRVCCIMWYRLRRLNVPLRQAVLVSTAATGVTAVAVGTGWCTLTRAHMEPKGGGLAQATGRIPEWGSEHVSAVRADWACIGANKASEDRLVVEEGGGGIVCAVFDGHYGPRASEFCKQNTQSYFAKVCSPAVQFKTNMLSYFNPACSCSLMCCTTAFALSHCNSTYAKT